jgi:hypothetical protein
VNAKRSFSASVSVTNFSACARTRSFGVNAKRSFGAYMSVTSSFGVNVRRRRSLDLAKFALDSLKWPVLRRPSQRMVG